MSFFKSFGLNKNPFSESIPQTSILMDERFQSSFDTLKVLPEIGMIGILTGRTGVGKTTLLQLLMKTWRVQNDVYYLHFGNLHSMGLLRSILIILGEQPRLTKDGMMRQFYSHLFKKQRPLYLIIDEAQLLDANTITDLRILCGDLDYSERFKLVLAGQPDLNRLLNTESIVDFRERISLQTHLSSMTEIETSIYLEHRLEKAGATNSIFDKDATRILYHHSEGIPRRLHQTALKAMLNASAIGKITIDVSIIKKACSADRS